MKKFICIVSLLVLVGCSNNSEKKQTNQSTVDTSSSAEEARRKMIDEANKRAEAKQSSDLAERESKQAEYYENMKYKLNEETFFGENGEKQWSITFKEASTNQANFPDHMISLDQYDTSRMIAVTIDYSNIDLDDTFLPIASDFIAYDENGKALTQVNQQDGQDRIGKGRASSTKLFWETTDDPANINSIEIDYEFAYGKTESYEIEVTH